MSLNSRVLLTYLTEFRAPDGSSQVNCLAEFGKVTITHESVGRVDPTLYLTAITKSTEWSHHDSLESRQFAGATAEDTAEDIVKDMAEDTVDPTVNAGSAGSAGSIA